MIETTPLRRKLIDLAISGKLVPKTDEWKMVKLGDVCDILTGNVFDSKKFSDRGVKICGGLIIAPDGIHWDDCKFWPTTEGLEQFTLRADDVVVALDRPWISTGTKVGRIRAADLPCLLIQRTARLRSKLVDPVWLEMLIAGDDFKNHCVPTGSTVPHISHKDIVSFEIPLPPLTEQKVIVKRLEELLALEREIAADSAALDDLIAAAKKKILELAVSGKLVDQDRSYGQARDILECAHCSKKKSFKPDVINSMSPPYAIPGTWVWCRAGDLGTMTRGSGIKRSETQDAGSPCIRYGEIYTSYEYRFVDAKSFVSADTFEMCKVINSGDLAFTLTGENKPDIAKTIAYVGCAPVAAGGDLAIWSNHGCEPMYLSYFMASIVARRQVSSLATGDIVCHISTDKVGSLWLPLPPLAEQRAIVARIDELFAVLDSMKGGEK